MPLDRSWEVSMRTSVASDFAFEILDLCQSGMGFWGQDLDEGVMWSWFAMLGLAANDCK